MYLCCDLILALDTQLTHVLEGLFQSLWSNWPRLKLSFETHTCMRFTAQGTVHFVFVWQVYVWYGGRRHFANEKCVEKSTRYLDPYNDVIWASRCLKLPATRLFARTRLYAKETSKLWPIVLSEGNPLVTEGIPSLRTSDAENNSIS